MKTITWLFILALVGLLPLAAKAQLTFTTNAGAITITGYTGNPTNVDIPDTINGFHVVSIAGGAFQDKTTLKSVTITNGVTNIGNSVFQGCTSLTNVTLGNSVTSIGGVAFQTCTNLPSITIPNSVTNIAGNTFAYCYSLTNVVIGDSVRGIGDGAFDHCTNLPSVTIPNSVTTVGISVFLFCSRLTNVVIGNSVRNIGVGAFGYCTKLPSVVIPSSVTNIATTPTGTSIFQQCYSLTNISVNPSNSVFSSMNGVLFNKDKTTLITCPAGVHGSYVIPASVASIGGFAFQFCTNLTSVVIPNSVTNIGYQAFYSCSGLTNVVIGDSVTSVWDQAFYYCTNLTSVVIPNSVTSIRFGAFSSCSRLTNITFLGNAPALGSDVFYGVGAGAKVYYYYGATGWGATYGGLPTVMLNAPAPQIDAGSGVGVQTGYFRFVLSGATNQTVVIEVSTNLANWQPIWTNTLSGTNATFTDTQWTNYPNRFYRAR